LEVYFRRVGTCRKLGVYAGLLSFVPQKKSGDSHAPVERPVRVLVAPRNTVHFNGWIGGLHDVVLEIPVLHCGGPDR